MSSGMEFKSVITFSEPTVGTTIFNDNVSIKTGVEPLVTLDVKGNGVDGILLPNGTTSERPSTNISYIGCIRYNTDISSFEGLSSDGSDGAQWLSLGGVSDINGDTKITAEDTVGGNQDILRFYAGDSSTEKLTILGSNGNVGINSSTPNNKLDVNGIINATSFKKNNTEITSTALELNLLDGSVAGTIVNSKAVIYGSAGEVNASKLQVNGSDITSTPLELNLLDDSVAGTIVNNKAVIYGPTGEVNASKLQVNGSDITSTPLELNLLDDSVAGTVVNSNAVIYGSAGEVNASKLQVNGSDITSTPLELNLLDGSIAGTIVNSKAVIYNENGNINANTVNLSTIKGLSNDVNINNYDGNGIEITNTVSKGLVVIGTNATESISGGTKLFVNGKIKTNNDIISSKLISNTNTSLILNNYNNSGITIDGSDNKVKINTNLEVDVNIVL
jgi:hypothetical protein